MSGPEKAIGQSVSVSPHPRVFTATSRIPTRQKEPPA